MLRGLFKGRRRRQRAKSRIRLAPAALHVSHVTCHMSSHVARHTSHVTRHTSQAFYANHNRKRGALRKENMRLVGAPLHCSHMTRCNVEMQHVVRRASRITRRTHVVSAIIFLQLSHAGSKTLSPSSRRVKNKVQQ